MITKVFTVVSPCKRHKVGLIATKLVPRTKVERGILRDMGCPKVVVGIARGGPILMSAASWKYEELWMRNAHKRISAEFDKLESGAVL